jgi:thymidylate kinase
MELILLLIWISILRFFSRRIITDRYLWDNQIIYWNKYGQPVGLMKILWGIAKSVSPVPDVTFFLNIPPEESYRRILVRNEGKEEEKLQILKLRAQMYDDLDQPGIIKINAMRSPEKVVDLVCRELELRGLGQKISGQISEIGE